MLTQNKYWKRLRKYSISGLVLVLFILLFNEHEDLVDSNIWFIYDIEDHQQPQKLSTTTYSKADHDQDVMNIVTNNAYHLNQMAKYRRANFSVAHHKTGTFLKDPLLRTITEYWQLRCNATVGKHQKAFWGAPHSAVARIKNIINTFSRDRPSQHIMALHYLREPLSTILSGYNYHKITDEPWIIERLNRLTYRKVICWEMNNIINDINTTWMNHSLQYIYTTSNMSIGLFIEYQRYKICQHERTQGLYEYLWKISSNRDLFKNDYQHLKNMRLDDFETNFNDTFGIILDTVGIFNDMDRKELLNRVQQHNVYRKRDDSYEPNLHVTRGTYNRTIQIAILLSDIGVCIDIKRMGIELDYFWEYENYC